MYHLHIRYITKGTGASTGLALDYITRAGRYHKRGDSVREVFSLNMPRWAKGRQGALYWRTADSTASRANARSAYMIEVALPKALSKAEQRSLVMAFAGELSRPSTDGMAMSRRRRRRSS